MKKLHKKNALLICILVTTVVMVLEFVVSAISNSLMLFSDGLHMLGHTLALVISLIAIVIAEKRHNSKIEYVAALVNGISLSFFVIYIFIDGIKTMIHPTTILPVETLVVSCLGLGVNLFTAFVLFRTGLEDLNTKSTFLHLLADTFSSMAVISGAIIIYYTRLYIIDALLSIVVSIVIAKWCVGLIKTSLKMLGKQTAYS
jgi:cobalt-zinc-cadmium efflux system protein